MRRQNVEDGTAPIRQPAGAERKAAADQDHGSLGIVGLNERRIASGETDWRLQKGLPQQAAAGQQILGHSSKARRCGRFERRQREFRHHVVRLLAPRCSSRDRGSHRLTRRGNIVTQGYSTPNRRRADASGMGGLRPAGSHSPIWATGRRGGLLLFSRGGMR